MDERKAEVLRALVEEYITTGEPVSSRAILERSGLPVSSATIRNDLAALEREGYVVQPHTSAGRAPTAKAYRFYVDHCSPARLGPSTRARIHRFFANFHQGLTELLKSTTELLSEITHYPAVVVSPGWAIERIRGVHLVSLGPQVLLAVLVSNRGRVTQELLRLEDDVELGDVVDAERALAELFDRGPILEAVGEVDEICRPLSASVASLVREVVDAVGRVERDQRDVFVAGTSQMAKVWEDIAAVRSVLELLEREAAVMSILARAGSGILIGEELSVGEDVDLAVVSTTYQMAAGEGTVGIIGPMRMDYRRAMSAVEEVGDTLEESLGS